MIIIHAAVLATVLTAGAICQAQAAVVIPGSEASPPFALLAAMPADGPAESGTGIPAAVPSVQPTDAHLPVRVAVEYADAAVPGPVAVPVPVAAAMAPPPVQADPGGAAGAAAIASSTWLKVAVAALLLGLIARRRQRD